LSCIGRWSIVLGVTAMLFTLVLYLQMRVPAAPALAIRTASVLVGKDAPPISVTLPHDWLTGKHNESSTVYRVEWMLNQPPKELWALFLPRVSMQADVFVNGHLLGRGGSITGPMTLSWNLPLYFPIPTALLHPGKNEIAVRVTADPGHMGLMREIYLGPHDRLVQDYRLRHWLDVIVPQWIAIFMLTSALFMGALWFLRREESIYGWYALGFTIWFLIHLNLVIGNEFLSRPVWDAIWNVGYGYVAVCTAHVVLRFLGERAPVAERLMLVYSLIGVILGVLAAVRPIEFFRIIETGAWDLGQVAIGVFGTWRIIRHTRWRLGGETTWMLAAGLTMFVFGMHDSLVIVGVIERYHGYFVHFSAPVVLTVFGAILLRRFVAALRGQETLSANLETRVRERESELETNYARLREVEGARLLAEERARIMRDMHDGVGGVLVSALAMVEMGQTTREGIQEAIRDAIHDLRLMIDSLDPTEGDLLAVLGMFRGRLEPRLAAAGVRFEWRVQDVPALPGLGPRQVLQILRILQEAVQNVLKHARARTVFVSTGTAYYQTIGNGLYIEIRDDGQGFSHTTNSGRGLANMRDRARAIGGECEVQSDSAGTSVRLHIPLG
jgi:signal transduction histidine kinase